MTSVDIPVSLWCWTGAQATAGVQEGPAGLPVLAVYLDPVNLVLTVPPFPSGPIVMARFLRELSRASARMADELEPLIQRPRQGGAHRAVANGPGAESEEGRQ